MRDIDLRATLEFCEFLGEQAWTKVLRNDGQLPFLVAKSGLNNQILQVGDLVDRRPKRIVCRRVSGKHQTPLAGTELITASAHNRISRQRHYLSLFQLDLSPDL